MQPFQMRFKEGSVREKKEASLNGTRALGGVSSGTEFALRSPGAV